MLNWPFPPSSIINYSSEKSSFPNSTPGYLPEALEIEDFKHFGILFQDISTNANFIGVHPFEKRLAVSDAREK